MFANDVLELEPSCRDKYLESRQLNKNQTSQRQFSQLHVDFPKQLLGDVLKMKGYCKKAYKA
ncbi:hypothetical protein LC653_29775 [Nostoc sp. CHAB 5784]|uniref:hypothetical protein n=1 Tax=Nostoc mirabile TaxID=2907820 RepID=UPI001E2DA4B7|nr:hypothetical protein [Nostoc mirabile]MCC5667952.1 hypothetical protein [Nostoc mirabile CHAB5784]